MTWANFCRPLQNFACLQALAAWIGANTAAELAAFSYWDLGSVARWIWFITCPRFLTWSTKAFPLVLLLVSEIPRVKFISNLIFPRPYRWIFVVASSLAEYPRFFHIDYYHSTESFFISILCFTDLVPPLTIAQDLQYSDWGKQVNRADQKDCNCLATGTNVYHLQHNTSNLWQCFLSQVLDFAHWAASQILGTKERNGTREALRV